MVAYKIATPLTAVARYDNGLRIITLPKSAVVEVIGRSETRNMVDTQWGGLIVSVFQVDLDERCEPFDTDED